MKRAGMSILLKLIKEKNPLKQEAGSELYMQDERVRYAFVGHYLHEYLIPERVIWPNMLFGRVTFACHW